MFSIRFIGMGIIASQVFFPACHDVPEESSVNSHDLSKTLHEIVNWPEEEGQDANETDAPLNLAAANFFSPNLGFLPPDPILPPFLGPEDDIFDDFLDFAGHVPSPICGDAVVQPREQCDDGNFDNLDGCNVICLLPICGNGALELFEQCDDNNNVDADGCTRDCIYERCGNFRVELFNGEECDDGNLKAGDGCSPCCKFERCGNRVLDPKEECDDGNLTNGDGCSDCCELEETPADGSDSPK